MSTHRWVIDTTDDNDELWHCPECGACGGPVHYGQREDVSQPFPGGLTFVRLHRIHQPPTRAFYLGRWPFDAEQDHLSVSLDDCETAARAIREHTTVTMAMVDAARAKINEIKAYVDALPHESERVLARANRAAYVRSLTRRVEELLAMHHGWPYPVGRRPGPSRPASDQSSLPSRDHSIWGATFILDKDRADPGQVVSDYSETGGYAPE